MPAGVLPAPGVLPGLFSSNRLSNGCLAPPCRGWPSLRVKFPRRPRQDILTISAQPNTATEYPDNAAEQPGLDDAEDSEPVSFWSTPERLETSELPTVEAGDDPIQLPRDALPILPPHMRHMAARPWVIAMQLRWVKQNLAAEQQEKMQYGVNLLTSQANNAFSHKAVGLQIKKLQAEVAHLGAMIEDCDRLLEHHQETECWRPH